jgi:hypothetical protein
MKRVGVLVSLLVVGVAALLVETRPRPKPPTQRRAREVHRQVSDRPAGRAARP